MPIFISGTDTNVGKKLISSWLCYHTGFSYVKPIQTGTAEETDSQEIRRLTNITIYPETYTYKAPVSPHLAAKLENEGIDLEKITHPQEHNLIIEGAGGLFVPLNKTHLMIDLIRHLRVPVILVARSTLGTINHTLLSLEALYQRHIPVLGVVMNGPKNQDNKHAIEYYGKTTVLAEFPSFDTVDQNTLAKIPLPLSLRKVLQTLS